MGVSLVNSGEWRQVTWLGGSFTTMNYIYGLTMDEIETVLGFHSMRLSRGALIYAPIEKPTGNDFFDFAGSTKTNTQEGITSNNKLNSNKEGRILLQEYLQVSGPKRLVKVVPIMRHNVVLPDEFQYPDVVQREAIQFKIKVGITCRLLSVLTHYPSERLML